MGYYFGLIHRVAKQVSNLHFIGKKILGGSLKHFHIPFAINFPDIAQVLTYQKHSFRGVIAKIGYLRPILTSRAHVWLIFMGYAIEIVPLGILEGF